MVVSFCISKYLECRYESACKAADLPYEFLAMEVALAAVCRSLDVETSEVEAHLGPALDNLTHKVCKKDLEDVRNLKSRLNRVYARTAKVKQAKHFRPSRHGQVLALYDSLSPCCI